MITLDAIKNSDMPAPDKAVRYSQHMWGPAMFHYAPETSDPVAIAKEHGFELRLTRMSDELDDEHPLIKLYFEDGGCTEVFAAWRPKEQPGWKLAGCHDTDDGPVAIFLRPQS